MASRSISDLDSRFRPLAEKLIAECQAAGVPVSIITTLRSLDEQKKAVAHGLSWTLKSKHLPSPPDGKALAMDLCPTELLIRAAHPGATDYEKQWSPKHPDWWVIAKAAVGLGLRSGMDWKDIGLPTVGTTRPNWDPSHVEYVLVN